MKRKTRCLSAVTAGLVLAASLAGCSTSAAQPSAIPLPDGVPEDIVMEILGISKDAPLLTVDGKDVPAEEVLYWVAANADQYAMYGMSDLSMDMGDGQTLGQFYLDSAVETATLYRVVENHAEELKKGWNKDNQEKYAEQLAEMKANIAAQAGLDIEKDAAQIDAEYVRLVSYMGLSQEGFYHINQASLLYNNLSESLYGETEAGASETGTPDAAKLEEAGILSAKHILIQAVPVTDGEGNTTDDGMAAALEKANSVYQELMAAEDPVAYFDELMAQRSEDPGSKSQPEGYTFGPGEMVQEFYDGTKALEVGGISQPVQSGYGYHIILRLDANNEAGYAKYNELQQKNRSEQMTEQMNQRIDQWMEEAKVEKTEALENLDVQAYYDGLNEQRTKMSAVAAAEKLPAETGAPAETGTPAGSNPPAETGTPAPTATPAPAATPAA